MAPFWQNFFNIGSQSDGYIPFGDSYGGNYRSTGSYNFFGGGGNYISKGSYSWIGPTIFMSVPEGNKKADKVVNVQQVQQQSDSQPVKENENSSDRQLYNSLGLEKEGLSYEVFALAMEGYKNLKNKGNGRLGIVDPKTKTYYLIDIKNSKFIDKTEVKFGSGKMEDVANANRDGSHATLSGFTQVKEEYASRKSHWSSRATKLDGLEAGINDRARSKSVVIHSTPNETTWGCIGFTPVYKNGRQDDAATNEKMRRLFSRDTIIFTYPTDVAEYKSLSTLV